MTQPPPLNYEPPTRRPPRPPIAAACFTFGGLALFLVRPRSPDLVEIACIIVATALSLIGGVLILKFVGDRMDDDWKRRRSR